MFSPVVPINYSSSSSRDETDGGGRRYLDVASLRLFDSLIGTLVVSHTLDEVIFRGEVRTGAEGGGQSRNNFI
jgi:hypothetical protein